MNDAEDKGGGVIAILLALILLTLLYGKDQVLAGLQTYAWVFVGATVAGVALFAVGFILWATVQHLVVPVLQLPGLIGREYPAFARWLKGSPP